MLMRIANGTIHDPANGIDGDVRDLWIRDSKIVAPPMPDELPDRTIDAAGLVVMPGGVDMHTHIAGPKVNAARRLRPDDRRIAKSIRASATMRSGTVGSVPSSFATGYLYAGLGYTSAVDAAIAPLAARHAHFELADTPAIDAAILLSLGDHHYGLERIAADDHERLREFVAWVMGATQAYGVKLVNPGVAESHKRGGEGYQLDEQVDPFGVTPRQILKAYSRVVDELRLPHSVHVHCAELGRPGNADTTLATMKAFEGRRGHFTHIQFHSYGGDRNNFAGFCSRAAELADYVNEHQELTVDVGQVLFGEATAMTGDSALAHYLARATGRRSVDFDTECEAGCGVVGVTYREKNLINAWQWAVGLEWFLLVRDPWRVAMSTDHPNGGAFVGYPEIVQLLMSRDYRREALARLPAKVRERTALADLDREYSLNEIAIITRAGPARILGLKHKGHLGVGADADAVIYSPSTNRKAMFELPRVVIKAGEVIVENGEVRRTLFGRVMTVAPEFDRSALPGVKQWFDGHYTQRFANFAIDDEQLEHGRFVVR